MFLRYLANIKVFSSSELDLGHSVQCSVSNRWCQDVPSMCLYCGSTSQFENPLWRGENILVLTIMSLQQYGTKYPGGVFDKCSIEDVDWLVLSQHWNDMLPWSFYGLWVQEEQDQVCWGVSVGKHELISQYVMQTYPTSFHLLSLQLIHTASNIFSAWKDPAFQLREISCTTFRIWTTLALLFFIL